MTVKTGDEVVLTGHPPSKRYGWMGALLGKRARVEKARTKRKRSTGESVRLLTLDFSGFPSEPFSVSEVFVSPVVSPSGDKEDG